MPNVNRQSLDRGIPNSVTGLRPIVHAFALKMEEKLQRDDFRKGHWLKEGVSVLWARFHQEVKELDAALAGACDPEDVAQECADVANLAMMIADALRGLDVKATAIRPETSATRGDESRAGAGEAS